jgi:indole-3-glycerol phosphate synthase
MLAVIAEVKRQSPSKGAIRLGIDPVAQARAYAAGGAAAISVLTEPAHFGGSVQDLTAVVQAVSGANTAAPDAPSVVPGVPVLKKDFHVDPIQLYQARAIGASAALLIVRALEPARLRDLLDVARAIGLETIVEVHTDSELDLALNVGAEIVGVNNRDLETLVIDQQTVTRLIPRLPQGVLAIAESGVQHADDARHAASAGADAILVGSAVSAAENPCAAVAELAEVPLKADVRPN